LGVSVTTRGLDTDLLNRLLASIHRTKTTGTNLKSHGVASMPLRNSFADGAVEQNMLPPREAALQLPKTSGTDLPHLSDVTLPLSSCSDAVQENKLTLKRAEVTLPEKRASGKKALQKPEIATLPSNNSSSDVVEQMMLPLTEANLLRPEESRADLRKLRIDILLPKNSCSDAVEPATLPSTEGNVQQQTPAPGTDLRRFSVTTLPLQNSYAPAHGRTTLPLKEIALLWEQQPDDFPTKNAMLCHEPCKCGCRLIARLLFEVPSKRSGRVRKICGFVYPVTHMSHIEIDMVQTLDHLKNINNTAVAIPPTYVCPDTSAISASEAHGEEAEDPGLQLRD